MGICVTVWLLLTLFSIIFWQQVEYSRVTTFQQQQHQQVKAGDDNAPMYTRKICNTGYLKIAFSGERRHEVLPPGVRLEQLVRDIGRRNVITIIL